VRSKKPAALPLVCATMLFGLFVFGIMMHERYAYPVPFLLLAALLFIPDRRLAALLLGISGTQAVNLFVVLQKKYLAYADPVLVTVFSLFNVLLCLYLFYTATDYSHQGNVRPFRNNRCAAPAFNLAGKKIPPGGKTKRPEEKRNSFFLAVLCSVYAVIAFLNLGSLKAPQNGWTLSDGEAKTAFFRLDEPREIAELYYYTGICPGQASYHPEVFPTTGKPMGAAPPFSFDDNTMFRWQVEELGKTAAFMEIETNEGPPSAF
jgi:hypothetical protein